MIIEEGSVIKDTNVGDDCLIEIYSKITDSTIGRSSIIGTKAILKDCCIGECCFVAPTVHLDGIVIPDSTSVYLCDGQWRCSDANVQFMVSHMIRSYLFSLIMALFCCFICILESILMKILLPFSYPLINNITFIAKMIQKILFTAM